jgi:integrase
LATFERRLGRAGKTTWRVRVRRGHGPKLTKSFARKADAEEWARSMEHKLDVGEHLPSAEARKRTLADAIDRYLDVTLPRARHRKNAPEQQRQLAWWRDQLGTRALVAITPSVLAEARDVLAKRKARSGAKVSGATINRYLSAVSSVLTIAAKEYGWIPRNPLDNVKRFEDSRSRERFLSDGERKALLEACDASPLVALRSIVELALATGARKGELLGLDWSNVDLDRRVVRFLDTKNGEARTVPLAPTAVAVLKKSRSERERTGPVFPFSVAQLHKHWRPASDAAGLADVRFHDLRHSAASYLAMSGASLMDIAAILGHKTLSMVKRYSHLSEQHTTAAVDRMAEKFLG